MRILVSGSRLDGATPAQITAATAALLSELLAATIRTPGPHTIVHGACPTGVDAAADRLAPTLGWRTEPHPADWQRHAKAAGPLRNQQMVDAGADRGLFFPYGQSPGTRGCLALWLARYPDPNRCRVIDLGPILNLSAASAPTRAERAVCVYCGQPARLYPCGWRCDPHRPRGGV